MFEFPECYEPEDACHLRRGQGGEQCRQTQIRRGHALFQMDVVLSQPPPRRRRRVGADAYNHSFLPSITFSLALATDIPRLKPPPPLRLQPFFGPHCHVHSFSLRARCTEAQAVPCVCPPSRCLWGTHAITCFAFDNHGKILHCRARTHSYRLRGTAQ